MEEMRGARWPSTLELKMLVAGATSTCDQPRTVRSIVIFPPSPVSRYPLHQRDFKPSYHFSARHPTVISSSTAATERLLRRVNESATSHSHRIITSSPSPQVIHIPCTRVGGWPAALCDDPVTV